MSELINLGVQSKKQLKDQVTPHKMALLVLVREYCVIRARECEQILHDVQNIYTESEERDFMFILLQLLQSADLELKELLHKLQNVSKPLLMEALYERLKELSLEGVRAVMDLFQSLPESLFQESMPLLTRTSVLGLFVRRMLLSFDKLSFSQVTHLHRKYKQYYDSWGGQPQVAAQSGGGGGGGWDMDGSNLGDASLNLMDIVGEDKQDSNDGKPSNVQNMTLIDVGKYSQKQAEFFIAQQAALLQYNESEALPAKKLQEKVTELLHSSPDLAEAHFLSYLNNLRVQEYCGAVDSLYHYFDRQTTPGNGNSSGAGGRQRADEDQQLSKGFRYAALNMASLQYRFGHREEALAAVHEAIRMAQEANDHICLQHALGWLQRLGVQGSGKSAYLLDRLVTKSNELNLAYLTSLGVQSFAKHNALAPAAPASIFEYLLKSDVINCQNSMSDLMCVSYAHKAMLWELYGRREMCTLSCQLMLHLNTLHMGVYHNGESECLALCHLARIFAQQGDYNQAFSILSHTKSRFPVHSQYSATWMLYEQQLMFERALHHGRWKSAEQAIHNMAALKPLESKYCRAQLCKERGETDSAVKIIQELLNKNTEDDDAQLHDLPEFFCRLLLLQGELYCSSGNPTEAGQPLLACLTLAKEHHFAHLVALATLHLAYVQFCLKMPQQALTLLSEVLLTLLTHGSLCDRARAQYLWARCQVALVNTKDKTLRHKALHCAVQMLGDVIGWFRKMESHIRTKDAIYYQARLYHELGYTSERNKCAHEFRQLDQQYPTHHRTVVLTL